MTRTERLMPNGQPRYVRIWDNGGQTPDRYTVAYTGPGQGGRWGITMSHNPTHPQGYCQHWESKTALTSGIGKRITFDALPPACQSVVAQEYRELWGLE